MKTRGPKFPNIVVQLSGEDGNIYMVIGLTLRALKRAGVSEETRAQFQAEVKAARSYDAALGVVMSWVEVQ